MNDIVVLRMPSSYRSRLIEEHKFYVLVSQERLLKQFNRDEFYQELYQLEEIGWDNRDKYFTPDGIDEKEGSNAALQEIGWKFQVLSNLQGDVRLSIIAGFYHDWEKN